MFALSFDSGHVRLVILFVCLVYFVFFCLFIKRCLHITLRFGLLTTTIVTGTPLNNIRTTLQNHQTLEDSSTNVVTSIYPSVHVDGILVYVGIIKTNNLGCKDVWLSSNLIFKLLMLYSPLHLNQKSNLNRIKLKSNFI